ncbi:MAG: DNA-3-methyladenine glycosylase 2 family protein, partial [Planctomycetota bacterium]
MIPLATRRAAVGHLRRRDPVLRRVIDEVGAFTLRPEPDRFGMLVRSIISQQISTRAARSIQMRLEERVAPRGVAAEVLLELGPTELRPLGLSPQKVTYVLDLAQKSSD